MIRYAITLTFIVVQCLQAFPSISGGVTFRFSTVLPSGYGLMGAYGKGAFANYNFGEKLDEDVRESMTNNVESILISEEVRYKIHSCLTNALLCYTYDTHRLYKVVVSGHLDLDKSINDVLEFKRMVFEHVRHQYMMKLEMERNATHGYLKRYCARNKNFTITLLMVGGDVSLSVISHRVLTAPSCQNERLSNKDLKVEFD